jgi:pyruvate dehydrogenase E1 component alpha subunit
MCRFIVRGVELNSETGVGDIVKLADLYENMLRIRLVEEAIAARYADQEMRCPVHLSVGQEATAVGVCAPLRLEDKVYSTHRSHAHYLAKGGDLKAMLAEIYGKAAGCCGGRGGSMHLFDTSVGMELSVPIVGSSIPLATGAALAMQQRGEDNVAVVIVGDAAIEEGVFHESMNFAELNKLPVIYVCENNLFSIYTPLDQRQPDRPLTDLAEAHGVTSKQVDGNDIEAVSSTMEAAIGCAREGAGPSFLVFETYRWFEHCGPNMDNHLGYRTEQEFEKWKGRDPVAAAREVLIRSGAASEDALAALADDLSREIDEAFTFAQEAPLPGPESAVQHVYA